VLSARFKHPEGQWIAIADFNPRFAHPPATPPAI